MNRVNVFAIHRRCINEGYGLIQVFTENIRISPTKLWRVCCYEVSQCYVLKCVHSTGSWREWAISLALVTVHVDVFHCNFRCLTDA